MPLTKRQKEILDHIESFIEKNGYAPSFEEIADAFGYSSLATVHEHLSNLERKGYIRKAYNESRSIELIGTAFGANATELPLLGAVAGYVGGIVDGLIMRFVDMVISFPRLILLIILVAAFGPSIFLIIAVPGLTQWPGTARIVRGEVLSPKEREFVQAAEALGYSRRRIIFRHLIPNALGPVIVAATLGIGNTIILEAGLSFLGLGVPPPRPTWGGMLAGTVP